MKKNTIYFSVIFVVALITMLPMFTTTYKSNHDTKFHLVNIMQLSEQIKQNPLHPSKVVGKIGNNFGYGTDIFYPPLGHFTTAYINTFINSPTISIRIVYFISFILSGISMFYLSKTLSKDNYIGLISAIIYMLFPYHLSDVYVRDALGESLLFIFLPLIFLGIYYLFNDNKKMFYLLFTIGYVGGMLSHLTMMVYFTFLVIIFLMFKYKETFKHIKEFLIASLFILLITSPFTVGLLEQKILGNYRVFKDGVMVQGTWGNALKLKWLIPGYGWGTSNTKYFVDFISLILLFYTIKNYKKLDNNYKYIMFFGIISLFLSSKLFPWDLLPVSFRMIQFPWRMMTFVGLSISVIAPMCLIEMKDKKVISFILILFLVLLSQPNLKNATGEVIHSESIESWYGMGYKQEYLPVAATDDYKYYNNRGDKIKGNADIIKDEVPYLEFKANESTIVELPRIYYTGYTLKNEKNENVKIYENSKGFIEAKVDKGIYKLDFTGTLLDKTASIISPISILLFGLFVWRKK